MAPRLHRSPRSRSRVTDIGTGAASLSWTPPTQNSDGSTLTTWLAIASPTVVTRAALDRSVSLSNPSLSRYMVENLSSGTWFFAVSAVNSQGVASGASNVASKTI